MNLKEMGWAPTELDEKIETDLIARITSVHRGFCKAVTINGDVNVYLSGQFKFDINTCNGKPATGDFIKISPTFIDEQNSKAAKLEEIFTRRSKISRIASGHIVEEQVLVANVEFAFIVTSVNEDFSINRLQRYILLAKEGGVTPIILLSKVDLVEDSEALIAKIRERIGEVEIIPASSVTDVGFEKIQQKLVAGSTSVFLGSSGVGKSTFVNKLLGEQVQLTKEIRDDDSKGRHATTARELFFLPSGGMIVDTAGLREVQVLASEEAVASTFKQVAEIASQCRFSDCAHESEPGCAIIKSLEEGELQETEYNNYLKLQKEAAFAEGKVKKPKSSNTKQRWKTVKKNYKARRKFEGKD